MAYDWKKELRAIEARAQAANLPFKTPFPPAGFSQRDAWELVEVAEGAGLLPTESAELLRWHMRRAFISYDQKDTPLSPGLTPLPFKPSYEAEDQTAYLERVAQARARVTDPPAFHQMRDKREGHYLLPGGRARARFGDAPPPEGLGGNERWPQPVRTSSSLLRLQLDQPPYERRTQSEKSLRVRKTFEESVQASETALAQLPQEAGSDLFSYMVYIPRDPDVLTRLGMFGAEAKILADRAGGRKIPARREPKPFVQQIRELFHVDLLTDQVRAQPHPKRVRAVKLRKDDTPRSVKGRPLGGRPHPKALVSLSDWPTVSRKVGLGDSAKLQLLWSPETAPADLFAKVQSLEKAITKAIREKKGGNVIQVSWQFGEKIASTKASLWTDESGSEHLVIDPRFVPREEPDYRTFKGATISTLPTLLAKLARRKEASTARSNPMSNWWDDPSDFDFVDAPLGPTGALAPALQQPSARRNRGRPVRRARNAAAKSGRTAYNEFFAHYRAIGYNAEQIGELWRIHKSGGTAASHRAKWKAVRKAAGKARPARRAAAPARKAKAPARKARRTSSHPGAEHFLPPRNVRSRVAKAAQKLIARGASKESAFKKAWAAEKRR